EVAERERVKSLLLELGHAKEVAGGLRHPRARQHQQPAVHPQAHHAMSRDGFRLRDLGLVMREDVVGAACVDVESVAEYGHRHRGAFDVPARKARSPRAGPDLHAVYSGRLPESEVTRVTLAWIRFAARAGQQLVG